MLQPAEDLPLLAEPALDELPRGAAAHELQRDRLLEGVVVAHRAVDGAHPAAGDDAEDPVGTDGTRPGCGLGGRGGARGVEGRPAGQELARFLVSGQQRLDLAPQLPIGAAGLVEERRAAVRRLGQRAVEDLPGAIEGPIRHDYLSSGKADRTRG